jgi:hypothetical protein
MYRNNTFFALYTTVLASYLSILGRDIYITFQSNRWLA